VQKVIFKMGDANHTWKFCWEKSVFLKWLYLDKPVKYILIGTVFYLIFFLIGLTWTNLGHYCIIFHFVRTHDFLTDLSCYSHDFMSVMNLLTC